MRGSNYVVVLTLVAGLSVCGIANASLISDRHVFYNNSVWDGNDPAANVGDDSAIAPDKTALLPGQTATFANYTSYNQGINGIMVDILGLPGTPTAADFDFSVGDGSAWGSGPAPTSVSVRSGAGTGGADRVTITWLTPPPVISNQWLRISVLPTSATGLTAADVFYFGNLIADINGDAIVNILDFGALLAAFGTTGRAIDDPLDITRDGNINILDVTAAGGNFSQQLSLFTAPEAPPSVPEPATLALFGLGLAGLGLQRRRRAS